MKKTCNTLISQLEIKKKTIENVKKYQWVETLHYLEMFRLLLRLSEGPFSPSLCMLLQFRELGISLFISSLPSAPPQTAHVPQKGGGPTTKTFFPRPSPR